MYQIIIKMNTQTPIQKQIKRLEDKKGIGFRFIPNHTFYSRIGINQKRFGMIRDGKIQAQANELKTLAKFFECNVEDLI